MIPDKYIALIHKAVFDGVDERERGELDAYLAGNPEARALHADLAKMGRALAETPEIEPPANLKKRILNLAEASRVELERQRGASRSKRKEGGIVMAEPSDRRGIGRRTGWLIGAGVAVVAIVLIVAFTYQSPSEDSARGTIGGAEKASKYRAGQIAEADVILENPEFQQLLQNDQVQDLIRSPEFQQLMSDPTFVELLHDAAFVELMSDEKFIELMSDPKMAELMSTDRYKVAVRSEARAAAELLSSASMAQIMRSHSTAVAELLSDARLPKLLSDAKFIELAQQATAPAELKSNAVFAAVASDAKYQGMINSEPKAFLEFLSSAKLAQVVASEAKAFAELASDPAVVAFMSDPKFTELMSTHRSYMPRLMSEPKLAAFMESQPRLCAKFFSDPKFTELMSTQRSYMPRLMSDAAFIQVMSEPKLRQDFLDAMPKMTR